MPLKKNNILTVFQVEELELMDRKWQESKHWGSQGDVLSLEAEVNASHTHNILTVLNEKSD